MRAVAASVVLIGFLWTTDSVPCGRMHPDLDQFKKRIGYDALPGADAPSGVVADWSTLPSVISQSTRGMALEISGASVIEPGLARASWVWKSPAQNLSVTVSVSGSGPRRAREELLASASATMMVTIPYQPGPIRLGDLAVRNLGDPLWHVYWVFQNVLVEVESEDARTPIEPVGRKIEAWMESQVVPRLTPYLPPIDAVEPSRPNVAVGDRIALRVRTSAPVDSLMLANRELAGPLFAFEGAAGLDQTYRAEVVGTARFEARIADRKTLLSPVISPLVVHVTAPRSP